MSPSNKAAAASIATPTTTPAAFSTPIPTTTGAAGAATTSSTTPKAKIMSFHNITALLALLLCGLATVNGLKCHMCGQYNEGVGSITPCLNYSDQYAHLYLKECSKKSEKFCVKYVSELSTVRDCATECVEKEIWETQTYCCNHDGCNGSSRLELTSALLLLLPLLYYVLNAIVVNTLQARR